jgi:type II secretory pathway predicted ATPase ExeA
VENPAQEKLALLSQLYQRLVQIHEQGRKAVVLIDEAQMLETRELMEEFRGLLNLEVPERKLISFVFFGLPEIERNLRLDPPLAHRVAMRYRLEPLNAESTRSYIEHRLHTAGGTQNPFTPAAIEVLTGSPAAPTPHQHPL